MAIVIKDCKTIVLQVPGTGSTAIEKALISSGRCEIYADKHSTFDDVAIFSEVAIDSTWEVVASVRNPYDWYVSEWMRLRKTYVWDLFDDKSFYSNDQNKKKEILGACAYDFSDWIFYVLVTMYELDRKERDCMFRKWTKNATCVFRYEDRGSLTNFLKDRVGLEIEPDIVNRGAVRDPYWFYYSKDARNLISDLFSVSLDKYGYCF